MNIIYNENKYILKIEKNDISIGSIQESILKTCSLMIYNIENTELFLKNGKSFILGSEQCIFKEKILNFIKNNVDEITPIPTNDETINYLLEIDKFILYDRKRDEKGNVIKNNVIIDKYNLWFEENENLKYLNQSSSEYNTNQPIYQNNNIISLFSNIFENSILNYQNDNQYINNLFRNYVNDNNNNQNINSTKNEEDETQEDETQEDETQEDETQEDETQEDETKKDETREDETQEDETQEDETQEDETIEDKIIENEDNNIQTINTTINDVQQNNNTESIINDYPIHNINIDEFSNMVNIFDTYINNSEREQIINNSRNSILYNYFNNMYSNINQTNNNIESQLNNNHDHPINNDVNEFITENNINTFIQNAPIFNIFRNMSSNIEIEEPIIINNNNDDFITFNIPIAIYNNNHQNNFEDVVVSLTEDEFNTLTCYECNDENNEKDCNICIECFNKGDNIIKLNCNHEFHKDCIKKWLCDNSTKCPICRVEVAKGKANL